MAVTVQKLGIRFRWWVKPLVYAAILPAVLLEVCRGRERCEAFIVRVGAFVAEHGTLLEGD
ncbi:hypothetical protein D3C87_2051580 [compost metagenome]